MVILSTPFCAEMQAIGRKSFRWLLLWQLICLATGDRCLDNIGMEGEQAKLGLIPYLLRLLHGLTMVSSLVHLRKYSGRSHKNLALAVLSVALSSLFPTSAVRAQALPTADQASPTPTLRDRLQRLQEGAETMPEPSTPDTSSDTLRFPTLGSTIFDVQLSRYLSYVEAVGTPDILIVGSSRSLQGIDPTELRYRLSVEGYDDLKVYNFSVNGATAQTINFLVSELLPGELPRVIVWGDGSRAFNNGRRDRTWQSLTASAGYQSVLRGEKPSVEPATIDDGSEADGGSEAVVVRSDVLLTVVEDDLEHGE